MPVINTNTLSMLTQNNLNKSDASLSLAIGRLSSGLRINSAKDDAAGLSIATRLTSSINGMSVAARNANDGISLSQTAEGALAEITNNLQRIRDLTVQAQNSSNSASDIDSIQSEVNQRMEEINRVTKQTDFNGIKVLDNRTAAAVDFGFQVGSKDGEKISIALGSCSGWNLATANADGTSGVNLNRYVLLGGDTINGTLRTVQAVGFDVIHGRVDPAGVAVGVTPLADIDGALKAVDSQRSLLGASQNRFESTIANLTNTSNNLNDARSRIQDADFATEVSNMSRAQIINQSGMSVLGHSNQKAQSVLSLLR